MTLLQHTLSFLGKSLWLRNYSKQPKKSQPRITGSRSDREGEAIAWHVAQLIKEVNPNFKRIQFNEITPSAIRGALNNLRDLNEHLFNSQQARRILDRLVGYKISPILWKKVKRGISAGRVQSVALRLIVDRERERQAFVPKEYWVFKAHLETRQGGGLVADLWKIDNRKANIPNEEKALELEASLKKW